MRFPERLVKKRIRVGSRWIRSGSRSMKDTFLFIFGDQTRVTIFTIHHEKALNRPSTMVLDSPRGNPYTRPRVGGTIGISTRAMMAWKD